MKKSASLLGLSRRAAKRLRKPNTLADRRQTPDVVKERRVSPCSVSVRLPTWLLSSPAETADVQTLTWKNLLPWKWTLPSEENKTVTNHHASFQNMQRETAISRSRQSHQNMGTPSKGTWAFLKLFCPQKAVLSLTGRRDQIKKQSLPCWFHFKLPHPNSPDFFILHFF